MLKVNKKKETKIVELFLILITLSIFLGIHISLENNTTNIFENLEFDDENDLKKLKISAIYNDIEINDLATTNTTNSGNWTWARTQPWCTQGNGTQGDPFIIENATFIYTSGIGNCLNISNSRKYFIIRNCVIRDSHPSYSGLILGNVTNGQIIQNDIYDNRYGIMLGSTNDTIILGNHITYNDAMGIILWESYHNDFLRNNVSDNGYIGISVQGSYNLISENIINDNFGVGFEDAGIYLGNGSTQYNIIVKNTLNGNEEDGIRIDISSDNIIANNFINGSANDGIYILWDNNNVTGNIINSNQIGISLGASSNNNLIYNNSFSGNSVYNGYDGSSNNIWNNSLIGNYWDDYPYGDSSPWDGIGDNPYDVDPVGGTQDYIPIFENPAHDGTPIHIDGNGANALNWSRTALVKWWCFGSGTDSKPYVIKELNIDGQNIPSTSCIFIENTNVSFLITNCTVYNSGSSSDDAGIRLKNVNNGTLIDNNCSNNKDGIYLRDCNNNSITRNMVNNNNDRGISIILSNFTKIIENGVSNNNEGINLQTCYNNTIYENDAYGNTGLGIGSGTNCYNSKFLNNTITLNDIGIELLNSNFNLIEGNNATNNEDTGILLNACEFNNISYNTLINNDNSGIKLIYGFNNSIRMNTIIDTREGIALSNGYNQTVIENNMTGCGILLWASYEEISSFIIDSSNLVNNKPVLYNIDEIGLVINDSSNIGQIILVNCNSSLISNLNITHTTRGISLHYCHNNFIINNSFSFNTVQGICLDSSPNNTIMRNSLYNNSQYGIIINGNYNYISKNVVLNTNGIYLFNCNYTIVSKNRLRNSVGGITLQESCHNWITGNIINNKDYGIWLYEKSNSNNFSGNLIQDVRQYGVYFFAVMGDNEFNLFYNNSFENNSNYVYYDGMQTNYWNNSLIGNYWDNYSGVDTTPFDGIGDTAYTINPAPLIEDFLPIKENPRFNGSVIHIDGNGVNALNWSRTTLVKWWCFGSGTYSNPYVIKDLIIDGQKFNSCISIENSSIYFRIENCTVYNSGTNFDSGIRLQSVSNGTLINNNVSYNGYFGINLYNSDNNTILRNSVYNNSFGINLSEANNNTISGNTVYNNGNGIALSYANNNTISGNTVYSNDIGIGLSGANDNTISGNNASNNQMFGISLQLSNYNTIIENAINNNPYYGIILGTSINSLIFNNSFIGNTINALDNGTNNQWDNGIIGNFWDDYGGVDANDDGIGDIPYLIPGSAGSQDNFPIWDDGDSLAPIITIHSPVQNEQFKITSPNFSISIDGIDLDTTWYFLSNGTYQTDNYIFSGLTGQINQLAWDAYVSGSIVITFCANDTMGNIGYQTVMVKKVIEYYILNPLIIDDTGAGNYTWSEAATKSWCFGIGTSSNPFVIEYIIIDGQNSFNCIEIRNSNAYFIIRNSIFYNGDAGIKLSNVTNGQLLFNNCTNNNGNGIELLFSNYNIIKENSINNNTINGISLINSSNNEILDNNETINDNGLYGIYLNFSDYNNISNNVINYNEIYGIYLLESDYNYIGGNTLLGNKEGAIKEENCNGNVIENNITKISKGFQIPLELIILLSIIGAIAIVVPAGAIVYKKKVSLPKKKKEMKPKLEKGEIITKEKFKIEKREDKEKVRLEKQREKIENKLQKNLNFVDYLIKENKTEIALKNLNEIESIAKSNGLTEFVNEVEQKLIEIKKLELDIIKRIKQTITNLGTKFSRLQLSDISEKSDIKDEVLIEKIIQEMIYKKEIRGEYFASSKALALEVTTPMITPEKTKDVNVFLSYSTLDADHYEISRIVRRLEIYPEISNVYFWEADSGENIVTFMEQTLQKTNVFVLFCSEHSIKSKAVEDEWQAAFQLRKEGLMKMVPVYEKDEHIPYLLKPILNVKFTKDNFDGFIRKLYEEILR